MSSQSAGRRRSNMRQYSAEDQALNMISKEAESRLAAKRAARAEAREIRLKELEKQQRESESKQDRVYELTNEHNTAKNRQVSGSRSGSRRGSTESNESESKDVDFKVELRELEEKYKAAMMTSAQLDNEKQSLVYQVELLKDQLEEQDEGYTELQRQYKDKCRDFDFQKRDLESVQHELNILKQQLEIKDRLIEESGFVIVSNDRGEPVLSKQTSGSSSSNGPLPSGAVLVSQETKDFLEKAGGGTLGIGISGVHTNTICADNKIDVAASTAISDPSVDAEDNPKTCNEKEEVLKKSVDVLDAPLMCSVPEVDLSTDREGSESVHGGRSVVPTNVTVTNEHGESVVPVADGDGGSDIVSGATSKIKRSRSFRASSGADDSDDMDDEFYDAVTTPSPRDKYATFEIGKAATAESALVASEAREKFRHVDDIASQEKGKDASHILGEKCLGLEGVTESESSTEVTVDQGREENQSLALAQYDPQVQKFEEKELPGSVYRLECKDEAVPVEEEEDKYVCGELGAKTESKEGPDSEGKVETFLSGGHIAHSEVDTPTEEGAGEQVKAESMEDTEVPGEVELKEDTEAREKFESKGGIETLEKEKAKEDTKVLEEIKLQKEIEPEKKVEETAVSCDNAAESEVKMEAKKETEKKEKDESSHVSHMTETEKSETKEKAVQKREVEPEEILSTPVFVEPNIYSQTIVDPKKETEVEGENEDAFFPGQQTTKPETENETKTVTMGEGRENDSVESAEHFENDFENNNEKYEVKEDTKDKHVGSSTTQCEAGETSDDRGPESRDGVNMASHGLSNSEADSDVMKDPELDSSTELNFKFEQSVRSNDLEAVESNANLEVLDESKPAEIARTISFGESTSEGETVIEEYDFDDIDEGLDLDESNQTQDDGEGKSNVHETERDSEASEQHISEEAMLKGDEEKQSEVPAEVKAESKEVGIGPAKKHSFFKKKQGTSKSDKVSKTEAKKGKSKGGKKKNQEKHLNVSSASIETLGEEGEGDTSKNGDETKDSRSKATKNKCKDEPLPGSSASVDIVTEEGDRSVGKSPCKIEGKKGKSKGEKKKNQKQSLSGSVVSIDTLGEEEKGSPCQMNDSHSSLEPDDLEGALDREMSEGGISKSRKKSKKLGFFKNVFK